LQAACVLAKNGGDDAAASRVDRFTEEFRWAQELGRIVLALKAAGHFDYQQCRLEVKM